MYPTTQHTSITHDARKMTVDVLLPTCKPTTNAAAKLMSAKQDAITLAGMVEHSFAQTIQSVVLRV